MNDEYWMRHALKLAKKAESLGEVPVGAVIVKDNAIVAEGWNQPILSNDATAHAEIMVLRAAGEILKNYRITDADLFVTLEPCSMCVGALIHARIKRVVFAANEPRTGALGGAFNLLEANEHNHTFEYESGLLADESREMIQTFFKKRRA
ncbi:MAG: tRNA adenosine(34) deaminase TadA [Gammaproteobacteria bacterium]|nr:tRNA adenosine(34) deaminase TadA [Gammaproteobacteria bacterium]